MAPTVWTERRKARGNVVPALAWAVPSLAGIAVILVRADVDALGLSLLGAGIACGWLTTALSGFSPNGVLRRATERHLRARGVDVGNAPFVGFATPRYRSALDAHEDVGFLLLLPDRIAFVSETRRVELPRSGVRAVRYRANLHTWIGLGGWVSVEGVSGGKPVRLLLEPRETSRMLGWRGARRRLRARIEAWRVQKPAA